MADCHLYKLPNELLLHLFVPLKAPELLLLTGISHRISAIILRILHNRLVAAAELESHSLLLECYIPSAKLFEPPLFCTYQGTDGLAIYDDKEETAINVGARLAEMRNMYSRYRPHQRDLEADMRRVAARPGDIPGSRTFPGSVQERYRGETVKQTLSLESHELFTQLIAQTNLVKIGPRNGLFSCFVDVEEGVLRVWKDWLGRMAGKSQSLSRDTNENGVGETACNANPDSGVNEVLWVSPAKHTGLRFTVKEKKFRRNVPILVRADEDMPVSYEIEYEELLIRTSHLLLMLEKSMVQEDNSTGKAVVFGSFG